MATYRILSQISIPTDRGSVEQRVYDQLSVDMLVHGMTRASVYARKVGKRPQLSGLRRNLRTPIIERRGQT